MTTYNIYMRESLDDSPELIESGLTSKNYNVLGLTNFIFTIPANVD